MTNKMIKLFENKKIRTYWHEEKEEWYFSIIDIVEVLTESKNPRRYWSDLKRKISEESGNEVYEKIVQLKMLATDGKMRTTDAADMEGIFRKRSRLLRLQDLRQRNRSISGLHNKSICKPISCK